MSIVRSKLIGIGSYLPDKVLTNDDLSKMVDTSDEWIMERTGIRRRHIADEGVLTSDLAVKAAQNALVDAGIKADQIDGIIVATTTPDLTFPATAIKVQAALEASGFAFDMQAVCSGFLYAMTVADTMIRSGQAKTLLVIGAETLSRIVDWSDRNTCVLFGDGAGAVLLQATAGEGTLQDTGVIASKLCADGRLADLLKTTGGVSLNGKAGVIEMNGREVFRHAVTNLAEIADDVLAMAGATDADLDWLVPHQANLRIIDATAKKLGVNMEKVILTVENQANTSAASIPLALDFGIKSGKIKKGDLLLLDTMGGGLTWGALLLRF